MRFVAVVVVALACSAPRLFAQAAMNGTGSFTMVDNCGGQSAFVGSTAIIEESSANCNVMGTISWSSPLYTVTATLPGAQVGDQISFVDGSPSPACLGTTTFSLLSASGTTFTFNQGSCTGTSGASLGGARIYVNYVKGSGSSTTRYDLKLLQQASGSWANTPTTTILTSASVRTNIFAGTGGISCSVGNPAGYFDGSNYYIAFIVQDYGSGSAANNCTNGTMSKLTPSKGIYYDLWGCKLGASLPGTMSTSNCGALGTVTSQGDGFLDPHFGSSAYIYATERNNANVESYASTYSIWSIDVVNVTSWASPAATIAPWIFLTNAQWDSGRARATSGCEEYYKLTGLFNLPGSSTIRAFFQMNYINGASAVNPFQGYGMGTCDGLGAGGSADQFLFSGLFYGDLTGSTVASGVWQGSHLTQLYPYPSQTMTSGSCLTPVSGNIYCYGEFPWMFHDGSKMLFLGNTVTQSPIVDLCGSTLGCLANFTAEIIQAQVSADYTQSALPMAIASYGSFSTMMDLKTANCGQTLSPANSQSACGLQNPTTPYYGNCGHLDIDEASGYLTCGNLTSFDYNQTQTTVRRTMVVSLGPAFFNSPISASGPFQMFGGVQFRSQ